MTNIHGIVWVITGILIAGTSAYLGKLMAFLIIGVGFIVFGSYKMLVAYMTKPKETALNKTHEGIVSSSPQSKYCSQCGAGSHPKANFCIRCGAKL
ncbi:hypothetical protein J4410_02545 [Candidatus Woesearchaeota archaeon]|nr:hypothetical protein [Candidatus Woesearchaeota archaeon]